MMQPIDTLQVVGVQDHGIANKERVAIFVRKQCDLTEYCLILTLPTPEGALIPVKDHLLWFGHGMVNPGDWVVVYTGGGTTNILPQAVEAPPGMPPLRMINMHWGKQHTIFQNRALIPMLIRIAGTAYPIPDAPAYQGSAEPPQSSWIR